MAKHHFFQLGPVALDLPQELAHQHQFEWVNNDATYMPDSEQYLFVDGQLNVRYRNNWYLISAGAAILDDPARLTTLPANLILLDTAADYSSEVARILALKQAHSVAFADRTRLRDVLDHDCFDGQQGGGLDADNIVVNANFTGAVSQDGHVKLTVEGDFDEVTGPLLNWRNVSWGLYDSYFDVQPELSVTGDVDVWFQVALIHSKTKELTKRYTLRGAEIKNGLRLYTQNADQMIQVSLYATGSGAISVGKIHVRLSRDGLGELFPGGQRLVDETARNTEILTYFDAGDLKPPLMVYFSGYRTAEGFEANFLMQHFKNPFMIIGDPRLEGGAFYVGSDALEQQIVDAIEAKLDALGFSRDQLLLSGLSMGTTGAIYYSAKLHPHAVIVGKPLVNLGNIAGNERINRPNGFPTSFDLLLNNQAPVSPDGVAQMNARFWDRFKQGDVSNVLYVLAYMENDDYDGTAFADIFHYLTTRFQGARLWHKGLVGRHNDDTPGITSWFIRQIERILTTDFNRVFKEG